MLQKGINADNLLEIGKMFCFRLLGLRVVNVYDVDSKTYLIKLAKLAF